MRLADESLTKITINIYSKDKSWLEQHYGYGWSEEIRRIIRRYIRKIEEINE